MPSVNPGHPRRLSDGKILRSFKLIISGQFGAISYHALTIWLFVCNDIFNLPTVGVCFGILNGFIAHKCYGVPDVSLSQILSAVPSMMLWTWSHLLVFNLHNQLGGLTEDAINKPWRPIPQGRISERQSRFLLYFLYPLTVLVASRIGSLKISLLELGACLWYNEFGGGEDPFLKNFLNGVGISCFLAGPLEIILQQSIATNSRLIAWLLIIASAIIATVHIQDFRDMAGDRASGRKTLPIVIGDRNARMVASGGILLFTSLSRWFWGASWTEAGPSWLAAGMLIKTLLVSQYQETDDFAWKKLWFGWLFSLFLMPVLKVYNDN